ncbi:MAG: DNA recombination protein RmuC [Hyphomicrobiaceae bacterium]
MQQALSDIWQAVQRHIGAMPVWVPLTAAALVLAAVVLVVTAQRRARHETRRRSDAEAALAAEKERMQRDVSAELQELKGRLSAMAELTTVRQAELGQTLNARLDSVSSRVGQELTGMGERLDRTLSSVTDRLGARLDDVGDRLGSGLGETERRTSETLAQLSERLSLIDAAQRSLTELSSQVVSLQGILANKQARGAFGQVQMETIIRDALPERAFRFQPTLSNGKRPDCLVDLPGASAAVVIDAKFPLEGFEALRAARGAEEDHAAAKLVRQHVGRHIDDIASKYLIPGETADTALMFVPSEAVYADLYEQFPDLIQKAHRARVAIVSPNVLMLAVQTMQAVIKDVRIKEQAGLIQREVGALVADVERLVARVKDLDRHFNAAAQDLQKVVTSAEKIGQHGRRIGALDLEEEPRVAVEPPRLTVNS